MGTARNDTTGYPQDVSTANTGEAPKEGIVDNWQTEIVRKPQTLEDWQRRVEVVKEIGDKRVVQAVPVLLQELMNITPHFVDNFAELRAAYPCSKALIKIGEPAVSQIKDKFKISPVGSEQLVLLTTLAGIIGEAKTGDWLGELQRNENVAARKDDLSELRDWILAH